MAVLKMKRLSIVGLEADKDEILENLAFLSAIEVSDQTGLLEDPELAEMASAETDNAELEDTAAKLSAITDTLSVLSGYRGRKTLPMRPPDPLAMAKEAKARLEAGPSGEVDGESLESVMVTEVVTIPELPKRGLFGSRPVVGRGELSRTVEERSDLVEACGRVLAMLKRQDVLKAELNRLESKKIYLSKWLDLDIPLSSEGTKNTRFAIGMIPLSFSPVEIMAKFDEIPETVYARIVGSERDFHNIVVLYLASESEEVLAVLKGFGFSRGAFSEDSGTAVDETAAADRRIAEINFELYNIEIELIKNTAYIPDLEQLHDALKVRMDLGSVRGNLLNTGNTFILSGYVAERDVGRVEEVMQKYTCSLDFVEPDREVESVPIKLKNNAAVRPYEFVTAMYSLPLYGELDPNAVMGPFFAILFGIMFGDAGYGIIMTALCGIAYFGLFGIKLRGGAKNFVGLFLQCGITTTIYGLITGSIFGDAIPAISKMMTGTAVNVPVLIDPMNDPLTVMGICFAIGFIHIMVGTVVDFYQRWREGDRFGAAADIGLWWVFFAGLIVYALGSVLGTFDADIGLYILLASVIGLVLTQGRSSKNIFAKLFSGILSLYNFTGYLSDVLSYSRLLALGLATSVISQVFNSMATLGGSSVFGIILLVVVFTIGHLLNFAINALGSYVHTSRLQYVEFFGKFYRSGGREFKTYTVAPKYVDIEINKSI